MGAVLRSTLGVLAPLNPFRNARRIGIPLKFDRATLEGDYGHFTRMLIDFDLSKPLPDSIMIEVGDDCLFLTLFFENVPSFCSICCSIGHLADSCHHATRFTMNITFEPNDKIPERGRSKIRQEYRPKHKSRDVPTSRVFETIKSDPLHTEHVDIDVTSYPVIVNMEALIDPPRVEPHLHNPEGKASSDTDSEGIESDFSHPTALEITGVQRGVSWADQSEDSGWKENATIVLSHSQHVTISTTFYGNVHQISFIYANVNYIPRRSLWNSLIDIVGYDIPWLVLRDFNLVLRAHETTGNISTISCDDFRAALTVCDLVDIETKGVFHTRIGRGRLGMVLSRLDRAVCSHSFLTSWSQIACVTLPRSHSDHHPLLVSCSVSVSLGPRPFRFQGMWVSHPSFLNLVRSVWSSSSTGSGIGIIVQKLKLLKKALRKWNWEVFGDITLNVTKTNENMMLIQGRTGSEGFLDDLFRLETAALADLDNALKQQ
ncbi:hypothetical protein Ddye_004939 [Dipteronia dyeriana]|uniref:Zinc knuckle CX2CX4HX4C domain-containing protein n=1 Tax=Dipteronia dyeriana TaxID=168575 RepID=A0AAE0CP84_9ROSI|nr:hypothetical protein Ddye_004939 [Dipteronia dyeriana]